MHQLIESLRDATMIETGQLVIETNTVSVATLIGEAFEILTPLTEGRPVPLRMKLEDELANVRCDRARILQVLSNLVSNAIKFTKQGAICIAARSAGDAVCFSVSDTGKGIAAGEVAHVFDRYWKGRQGNRQGTGLGLFIAKAIVEAHGGTIRVESAVGVGTTFRFTLPVAAPGDDRPSQVQVPPSSTDPMSLI
jgi:signal transduction histidine kinase